MALVLPAGNGRVCPAPRNCGRGQGACGARPELPPATSFGTYIGCFRDNEDGRDLIGTSSQAVAGTGSLDSATECAGLCAGFSYFGLQWVNECFCDNSYNNGYGNNANQADCPNGECPADHCDADGVLDADGTASLCANGEESCGNRNAVYSNAEYAPPPPPPPAPAVDRPELCRMLECGRSGGCGSEEARCAEPTEGHEVGCCADSAVPGFAQPSESTCPLVWGERDGSAGRGGNSGPLECQHTSSFLEAHAFCHEMGGRLCTVEELRADCTRGTGCGHDADLLWTSTLNTRISNALCSASVSIAVDNAYTLYVNGEPQVSDGRAAGNDNIDGCGGLANAMGDELSGCNWQSVDLFNFDGLPGETHPAANHPLSAVCCSLSSISSSPARS